MFHRTFNKPKRNDDMYSPEMSNFLNNIEIEERESLRIQREMYLSNANGCYDEEEEFSYYDQQSNGKTRGSSGSS